MDKNDVILTLKKWFEIEGNCVFLHFLDGSVLLINKEPQYYNLMMNVILDYDYGNGKINESCHIPYASILYIITTNVKNLQKINEEQNKMYEEIV